jgi:glycosyltransferase involved in cell wall biosynthesis
LEFFFIPVPRFERMKVSIVTINFNNVSGLKKTVESVAAQSFKDIEYVIIDGASTDDSINIIKRNKDIVSFFISENDNGIYDAMNKGITNAKGDYLLFLNSGDYLAGPSVMQQFNEALHNKPGFDIYYGDMIIVNDKNIPGSNHCRYPDTIDLDFLKKDTLNHQTSLIHSGLFHQFGTYPLEYKMAADYWLFLLAFLNNKTFCHLPFPIANYDLSGISAAQNNLYKEEKNKIWERLVPIGVDKVLRENEELKHLLNYNILKFARRLNSGFQKLKGNG